MKILRKSLVKKQEIRYFRIYENSPIYGQIIFQRSKLYQKQLKFDLALRDLNWLEDSLKNKLDKADAHTLFADIHEEYGAIYNGLKNAEKFVESYNTAINM